MTGQIWRCAREQSEEPWRSVSRADEIYYIHQRAFKLSIAEKHLTWTTIMLNYFAKNHTERVIDSSLLTHFEVFVYLTCQNLIYNFLYALFSYYWCILTSITTTCRKHQCHKWNQSRFVTSTKNVKISRALTGFFLALRSAFFVKLFDTHKNEVYTQFFPQGIQNRKEKVARSINTTQ